MEAIFGLIVLAVGWWIFATIVSAGARTVRAAGRAAVGKGSLSENLQVAFQGIPPFQTRLKIGRVGEESDSPVMIEVEGRGLFPISRPTTMGFVTSVFDVTDEEPKPVISVLEDFQEPSSIVYQQTVTAGQVLPNHGFVGWLRIGVALPGIIQTPRSGKRTIRVVSRMVDVSNSPPINNGFGGGDHPGLLWIGGEEIEYDFELKGYEEETEDRTEAQGIGIKIAVAVAASDGSFQEPEGEAIRDWILRSIEPFSGTWREELKDAYNAALREGYEQAESGVLSLSALTERLNAVGDRASKYETVELCFDVMAADGAADSEELKLIRSVAESLELDYDEIERMRDQRIVGLDSSVSEQADVEVLLGIAPEWDRGHTLNHIRTEYQKWSNRLNALPEGVERENAQRMLDLLAEARTKYAEPGSH